MINLKEAMPSSSVPWATFCCPEFRVQAKKQTVRSGLRDTQTQHWAHLHTTVKKNRTKKKIETWIECLKNIYKWPNSMLETRKKGFSWKRHGMMQMCAHQSLQGLAPEFAANSDSKSFRHLPLRKAPDQKQELNEGPKICFFAADHRYYQHLSFQESLD